jgi:hypothetical protein
MHPSTKTDQLQRVSYPRVCAVVLSLVFCLQALPSAQFSVARISGRVVDQSGRALPGVTIIAALGEQRRTVVSGADGHFDLRGLPAGTYAFTAGLPGFRTERRTVQLIDAVVVNVTMRTGGIGCADDGFSTRTRFFIDPPVVDPRVPQRSDLVAYFVLDRRVEEDAESGPDCRIRYRATVLRTATSPRYGKLFLRTIDVLLKPSPTISEGNEYIAWLAWRSDRNAFDSGDDAEGVVRRVERGQVRVRDETYSIDELFKIFEDIWVR